MNILAWHVHGSWMTAFVTAMHDLGHRVLIPLVPDRGPDGRGRALTWDWPESAVEITPAELRDAEVDVVLSQEMRHLQLAREWTGRAPGLDVPTVHVEHNAPDGAAATTRHPLADRTDIPLVHVTAYNALMWDSGRAPVTVVDHGVVDPGHLYTGERARLSVVVNEPVRRGRIAGTDLVLGMADTVPLEVYGMGTDRLADLHPALTGHTADLPQAELHRAVAGSRAYFHPYRWTSLGLSLIEAMMIGLPVVVVASTAAAEAVPPEVGVTSARPDVLAAAARDLLADPELAAERGRAARRHALARYGIDRFATDWSHLLKEVL